MKYTVVTFNNRYQSAFRELNLEWIQKYFKIEKKDLEQVDNPQECLNGGGEIFFVLEGDLAVGTCAMYSMGPRHYELAKMAVNPAYRGQGLGDLLMQAAEKWAFQKGCDEIHILSNTILEPAIALYKKHGYETIHLGTHPDYERCNIEMRKFLS